MLDFLKAGFLGVLLFAGVAQAERPNVLFLAVDDMNDWIGSLGTTPRAVTPNLDKLAARGVNFSNAHTPGGYCAPARAAIFSGQFASTTGCYRSTDYFTDRSGDRGSSDELRQGGVHHFGRREIISPHAGEHRRAGMG